ncbi:RNA polymerase sigma factor SigJ [Streptomyces sp. NPDC012637]|uniref:RNA polymerase sigma factor SigJ n=1 Tax=Streptomyces sp. NPDC012637 TaxID=3364842 RepID=UPI0036E70F73
METQDDTAVVAVAAGYRPLLFSLAYGMTGSVGDAEDIVQDAFLGMTRAHNAGTAIAAPKAYLTTAVTRLGINHLGSARVRRETYVGDWLPEPVVVPADGPDGPGPAEHAELADTLSMAFLVLLEALSPVERAVFVLREVFGHDYADIARITDKSEANCRQIFARARRRIPADAEARARTGAGAHEGSALSRERRAEGAELARRFFTAAQGGDLDALLGMLAPDVVFHGDGGGKAQAISRTVREAGQAARMLLGGFRRIRSLGATLRAAWINGNPGAVLYDAEDRVLSVIELHLVDGEIRTIHSLTNPDKLTHLGPVSDQGLLPGRTT